MATEHVTLAVPTATARTWSTDPALTATQRKAVAAALNGVSGDTVVLDVPQSWSQTGAMGDYVKSHPAVLAMCGKTMGDFGTPTLIAPPAFPTAAQLKSPKTDTPMPADAVALVEKQLLGEMHARWHTTRDFGATLGELDPKSTDPKTQAVLSAWQALRTAQLGVPAPNPPAGTQVDPKQTAFINAMQAFVAANPKSKDSGISDVVDAWTQVQKQNWPIPARQEGDPGNGLDFLTMHHEMILMMKSMLAKDPVSMAALNGWSQFPTPAPWPYDPKDSTPGVGKAATAVNLLNEMFQAATPTDVAKFKTDFKSVTGLDFDSTSPDQFGLWIQSSAGGLPNSGIHNWMHNEYEIPKSPVEMDSFVLNVRNPHFWGLHGTIDNAFMKFLSLRGMSVDSPVVKTDLATQAAEMGMQVQPEHGPMPMGKGMSMGAELPRNADGIATQPDGGKLTPFDKMSPELKSVLEHAQQHMVQRGLMK